MTQPQWEENFKEKYTSFELCEYISARDQKRLLDFISQERTALLEGIRQTIKKGIEPSHSENGATTDEDDSLKLIKFGKSQGLQEALSIVEKYMV